MTRPTQDERKHLDRDPEREVGVKPIGLSTKLKVVVDDLVNTILFGVDLGGVVPEQADVALR